MLELLNSLAQYLFQEFDRRLIDPLVKALRRDVYTQIRANSGQVVQVGLRVVNKTEDGGLQKGQPIQGRVTLDKFGPAGGVFYLFLLKNS